MSTSASPGLGEAPASASASLPTKTFEGHTAAVLVEYIAGGKQIVSASKDGTVRVWNTQNQQQENESIVHEFEVVSMAISPDQTKLVSGGYEAVVLCDLASRNVIWRAEVKGGCVAYSPSGHVVAAADNFAGDGAEVVLLHAETGKPAHEPLQVGNSIRSLAFSPNGTRLAAGSADGKVRIFDVETGETVVAPFAHRDDFVVASMVFTPGAGQHLITASHDGSIRVWDSATGLEVGNPIQHTYYFVHIAVSPDGRRVASVPGDGAVRIWDLSKRTQIGEPLKSQNGAHRSVAWSPDGRSVVTGDHSGGICVWDLPPLEQRRANSLSSSLLDLPAGTQPQNQPDPKHQLRDKFFESSLDLPTIIPSQSRIRTGRQNVRVPRDEASRPGPQTQKSRVHWHGNSSRFKFSDGCAENRAGNMTVHTKRKCKCPPARTPSRRPLPASPICERCPGIPAAVRHPSHHRGRSKYPPATGSTGRTRRRQTRLTGSRAVIISASACVVHARGRTRIRTWTRTRGRDLRSDSG
ncbi:WD40-repeat-containing domain protein [Hygrophoropsis aurantiaca]|uniref:WD40-repeat-containing domain protein n=1 Tax=Hygrophoropsis aurantiaca TaxID=72124 RepID=A0ACB7ZZ07_9AGAM|nr:WD40-repeat-containing domain protein [Hygrophoropsis aurantiaca]